MKSQPTSRIAWIDNLRTFVIFLVVSIHACVTYSYIGGWYVNVPPGPSPVEQLVFILWQAHLQAFFMGLLFFLAGVFAHRALLRRDSKAFMQERFLRLGVPSLLYMLVIQPCIIYFLLHHPEGPDRPAFGSYWANYVTSGQFLSGNGPMWFAIARWLSDRSFGVYMLHSPIMVALTPLCDPIANMSRLVAADVLTVATLIGSFIVADMTKRIPFLKRML
jgi:glucan biosynthesis protein C